MNFNAITPAYNNKPINPIEALKSGATQAYTQKVAGTATGDFLSVLHGAIQKTESVKSENGHFETTMISKEITDLTSQNSNLLASNQHAHDNFFSLLNTAYHSLSGMNTESIAGLPSNFSAYISRKIGTQQGENTLFNEGITPHGDVKRAKRSYEAASSPMMSSAEVFEA